ncbi:hypothetical protein [Sorangium sp. So ce1389]|uniref:hypothetical protein n=1 Tax=Sorangium sp. So ce1389 TaxID=3133336 RepID=UPI003F6050CA
MTTLVSWLGVDQRGPTSLYLASDSRFTWESGETWDYGRKLFASRSRPVILGYCGDVLFASQTIAQALDLIDLGLLVVDTLTHVEHGLASLTDFLQSALTSYPKSQQRPFSVICACRSGSGMTSNFGVSEVSWSADRGWLTCPHTLPAQSAVVVARGSGNATFGGADKQWRKSDIGGTSRAVYSAFCDHVASGTDAKTGGAPQLVGIYRVGAAITFGVIYAKQRWLSGAPVATCDPRATLEWRDDLFQRCDGHTLGPLPQAQRHARPAGL